jgi:hypothetical protein
VVDRALEAVERAALLALRLHLAAEQGADRVCAKADHGVSLRTSDGRAARATRWSPWSGALPG